MADDTTKLSPRGFWIGPAADLPHSSSPPLAYWIARLLRGHEADPIHDFGCGLGYILRILSEQGFSDLTGYEGAPPEPRDFPGVVKQDLTERFKVSTPGHVICLEVLEHIPAEHHPAVLSNLADACAPGHYLVASWAVRGQTGFGHCSERDNYEAIAEIQEHGFKLSQEHTRAARGLDHGQAWWFAGSLLIAERVSP